MPKILDLQLKTSSLVLRLITGLIAAAFCFILLYYIPANLPSLIYSYGLRDEMIINLVKGLINPMVPAIGLAVATLELISAIMRGSKIYGPITIILGVLLAFYFYLLFQQGTIVIPLSGTIYPGLSGSIIVQASTLMLLFMLPGIFTILKGTLVTLQSTRSPR